MKTKDLYQTINAMVRKHTGINEIDMLSSNKEACVDARYILIHLLSQFLTDEDISRNVNIPRQSINRIRNNFDCRINKWTVRNCLSEISTELSQNSLINSMIAH